MSEDIRKDLKDRFSDGKIPSGQDFQDLIDAYALDLTVQELQSDFEGRFTDEGFDFGGAGARWTLNVDEDKRLSFSPDPDDNDERAPTVKTGGWSAAPARMGLWREGDGDGGAASGLKGLTEVQGNGSIHQITKTSGQSYALEIVAHMDADPVKTDYPARHWFKDLILPAKPWSSTLHGVAVVSGLGGRPSLTVTSDPGIPGWFRGWPLIFYPLPFALTLVSFIFFVIGIMLAANSAGGAAADLELQEGLLGGWIAVATGVVMAILGVFGLLAGLRQFLLYRARRAGLTLEWRRESGSGWRGNGKYTLVLKGGPMQDGTTGKIHYHVTKLWG